MPIDLRKKSIIIIHGVKKESPCLTYLRHNRCNNRVIYTPIVPQLNK